MRFTNRTLFGNLLILQLGLFAFFPLAGQEMQHVPVPDLNYKFSRTAYSDDGLYVAAVESTSGKIVIYDRASSQIVTLLSAAQYFNANFGFFPTLLHFLSDTEILIADAQEFFIYNFDDDEVRSEIAFDTYTPIVHYEKEENVLITAAGSEIKLYEFINGSLQIFWEYESKSNLSKLRLIKGNLYGLSEEEKKLYKIPLNDPKEVISAKFGNILDFDFTQDRSKIIVQSQSSDYTSKIHYVDLLLQPLSQPITLENQFLSYNHQSYVFNDILFFLTFNRIVYAGQGFEAHLKLPKVHEGSFQLDQLRGRLFLQNKGVLKEIDFEGAEYFQANSKSLFPFFGEFANESASYLFGQQHLMRINGSDGSLDTLQLEFAAPFSRQYYLDESTAIVLLQNSELVGVDLKSERIKFSQKLSFWPSYINYVPETGKTHLVDLIEDKIWEFVIGNSLNEVLELDSGQLTAFDANQNLIAYGTDQGNLIVQEGINTHTYEGILFNGISAIKIHNNEIIAGSRGRMLVLPFPPGNGYRDKSQLLLGHSGKINSISVDEQSGVMLTTGMDSRVLIWNTAPYELIDEIRLDSTYLDRASLFEQYYVTGNGPDMALMAVSDSLDIASYFNPSLELLFQVPNNSGGFSFFNHDGSLMASLESTTIKIRDVQSGFLVSEFSPGNSIVNDAVFLENASVIAVASGSNIEYFDVYTGESLKTIELTARNRSIHEVDLINNMLIATNKHGWHLPVGLHVNSAQYLGEIQVNSDQATIDNKITAVEVSPNRRYIATYGGTYIKVLDAQDGNKVIHAIKRDNLEDRTWPKLLDFDQQSRYLMYYEFGGRQKILDLQSGEIIEETIAGTSAFGPGNTIIRTFKDGEAELATLGETNSIDLTLDYGGFIRMIDYSAEKNVFLLSDEWGNLLIVDATTGTLIRKIDRFENYNYGFIANQSGKSLVFNNRTGLYHFNLTTLSLDRITADGYPFLAETVPGRNAVLYREDEDIYLYNTISRKKLEISTPDLISEIQAATTIDERSRRLLLRNPENYYQNLSISNKGNYYWFTLDGVDKYYIYDAEGNLYKTLGKDALTGKGLVSFTLSEIEERDNGLVGIIQGISKDGDKVLKIVNYELDLDKQKLQPISGEISYPIGKEGSWEQIRLKKDMKVFTLSPDRRFHAYIEDYVLKIDDLRENVGVFEMKNPVVNSISYGIFSNDGDFFYVGYESGLFEVISLSKGTKVSSVRSNKSMINRIVATEHYVLLQHQDNTLQVVDPQSFELRLSVMFFNGDDFLLFTREGYYMASETVIENIAMKQGRQVYPISVFDLAYNRPDKVVEELQELGLVQQDLVLAYQKAYSKRLENQSDTDLIKDLSNLDLPQIVVLSPIPVKVDSRELPLEVKLSSPVGLSRLHVYVDGNRIYGSEGLDLSSYSREYVYKDEILLSPGENQIRLVVEDQKGVSSFVRSYKVYCSADLDKGRDLYLVTFNVSDYDSDNDLKYARKDGQDIAERLANSALYKTIYIDSLFDGNAIAGNFLKLKKKLMESSPEDHVILFLSGHGLLGSNEEFYMAGHDCDFENPETGGLPYDKIMWMLDSIPSRNKILMIDACHSGLVDKGGFEESQLTTANEGIVGTLQRGTGVVKSNSRLQLSDSFVLMQDLFSDVKNETGAVVISAAAGDSYAYESDRWRNGVFTYSLLDGLERNDAGYYKADKNFDRQVTISELKEYVSEKVQIETGGRQKPTSRQSNLENDFVIWK